MNTESSRNTWASPYIHLHCAWYIFHISFRSTTLWSLCANQHIVHHSMILKYQHRNDLSCFHFPVQLLIQLLTVFIPFCGRIQRSIAPCHNSPAPSGGRGSFMLSGLHTQLYDKFNEFLCAACTKQCYITRKIAWNYINSWPMFTFIKKKRCKKQ